MTKRLEELFELDKEDNPDPKPKRVRARHQEIASVDDSYQAIQQISADLPSLKEIKNLDQDELDSIADKAETAYDDLMDLGMNVEVRYASRIFEVASSMLKNAIEARNTKVTNKLKAVDLQLKKLKIDTDSKGGDDSINGEGYVITDRNELLKKLGKKD